MAGSTDEGAAERLHDDPHPRRTRRMSIPGVLVAIDAPEIADGHFVVDAIDLNADGLGLVLPPELPEGAEVELSFKLEDGLELSRVPAIVRHRAGSSGGVRFEGWSGEDRLQLLEFLVRRYELGGEAASSASS